MKTGLVLEGGAMRGMFTAGVLDVLLENDIAFDCGVGVSAGAVFGCNYKSRQPGRAIRYNLAYCSDKRYASLSNLLKTGDLYDEDFCYHRIPDELDPFDRAAFAANPMEFHVVCTDVLTGQPVYHRCTDGGREDLEWMRASASMPLASKVVSIAPHRLLDGGVADSIPLRYLQSLGCERCVVVLTQPKDFQKKKNRLLPVMRTALHRYPAFLDAVATRHLRYNETLHEIARQEGEGRVFVLRPPIPLEIGPVERDPAQLRRVYRTGRAVAQAHLEEMRRFLTEESA